MTSFTFVADPADQVVQPSLYLVKTATQVPNLRPDGGDLRQFRPQGVAGVVRRPVCWFSDVGTAAVADVDQAVMLQQAHHLASGAHGYAVLVYQVPIRGQAITWSVFALLNGPPE